MEEKLKNLYKQIEVVLSFPSNKKNFSKEELEMYADMVNLKNSLEKAGYKIQDTFWLLTGIWNEETEVYKYLKYEVPIEWLEKNVVDLEEFIDEYTSDETTGLYEQALLDNVVLNEKWAETKEELF